MEPSFEPSLAPTPPVVSLISNDAKASQSSTKLTLRNPPIASKAIDGSFLGSFWQVSQTSEGGCSFPHPNNPGSVRSGTFDPWWKVELPNIAGVTKVIIWNRTDNMFGFLRGAVMELLDKNEKVLKKQKLKVGENADSQSETIIFESAVLNVQFVKVKHDNDCGIVSLAEVEVEGFFL